MMNRETTIQTSDTLVVVDASARRRRRMLIIAVAAIASSLVSPSMLFPGGDEAPAPATAGGQVPTVT